MSTIKYLNIKPKTVRPLEKKHLECTIYNNDKAGCIV